MTTDPFMVQYIIENCTLVDYVTLANNAKVSVQTAVKIIKKAGLWDKCARVPRSTLSKRKGKE